MDLLTPSGGLLYHAKALRYHRIWQETRAQVAKNLSDWIRADRELVLIGPSAGYLLDPFVLQRAPKIYAYDIDPLALWLLRRKLHVTTFTRSVFTEGSKLSLSPFEKLLIEHPKSDLVFCNILGQLPVMHAPPAGGGWPAFWAQLLKLLQQRRWLSFHDHLSQESDVAYDHQTDELNRRLLDTIEWQLTPKTKHILKISCGE